MPKLNSDRLLSRGVWCLIVGVFTSWLGVGLLFILAAAVCAFVGLFRQRVLQSSLLLVSSLVLGVFCAHLAAVIGIYTLNNIKSNSSPEAAPISASSAGHRK